VKLEVSPKAILADGKIKLVAVRVGKAHGAKVYLQGLGFNLMKKTLRGWAVFKVATERTGILRITSPRACNQARVGVTPPDVPPLQG
jgi:hypothetical protein